MLIVQAQSIRETCKPETPKSPPFSHPFLSNPKSDSLTPHILGATHTLSPKPAVFGNYFWLYAPESLPRCLRDHVGLDIQVELAFDHKASARNKTLATHAADPDSNPQKY